MMSSILKKLPFVCLFVAVFSTASLTAQTVVLEDVRITNELYRTIMISLTNSYVKTFPYDEAYGADSYWTKWDVLLNDDNTYAFRLNNKYLTAAADGSVTLADSLGDQEKFHLEAGNGSYYLRTWRGSYVSAVGDGWDRPSQIWEQSSAAEWLFFDIQNPTAGDVTNISVTSWTYRTIMILLTNSYIKTFPYDEAYGADSYWTKWAVQSNGDNTYSFKLNNRFLALSAEGTDIVSTQSSETALTLEDAGDETFYIRSADGVYLTATGDGWDHPTVSATPSEDARFYFFNRNDVTLYDFTSSQVIDYDQVSSVDEVVDTLSLAETFTETPAIFANMMTFSGTDTSDLRISNVDTDSFEVFVQEEQSADTEVAHNNETIGFLALQEGVLRDTAGNTVAEVGRVTFTQDDGATWFTVDSFLGNYSNPVVIMVTNTVNGDHASHIRLQNVTTTSFRYQLEEWDYLDGNHVEEDAVYLIVEAGSHTLANGAVLQATTATVNQNAAAVSFPGSHAETPVVLSQTQTLNGTAAVNTRMYGASTDGVTVLLQEEESNDGIHNPETVAVVSYGL